MKWLQSKDKRKRKQKRENNDFSCDCDKQIMPRKNKQCVTTR